MKKLTKLKIKNKISKALNALFIGIAIIGLAGGSIGFGIFLNKNDNLNQEIKQLEKEKLKLEIEKLKQEVEDNEKSGFDWLWE
mgnify:CR=1 FL=1